MLCLFLCSVSPASDDRAECGNGASVLADGDNGLRGQGGSSSEVIEGGVLKEDGDAGPKKWRTEMELEAEFVRDQMKQYEQVSFAFFYHVLLSSFIQATFSQMSPHTWLNMDPYKGPSINDVTQIFHISGPPPPLVTHSRNLSVLFVRKIGQFLNPPPPFHADVICTWSLT